ncbi:glycoside hydrolase family 88 protein [Pelagicoccus mobilis]|uniref:Glycoside hydrolase family 88 protein n=1 Tax=Pelagicoccus mobilis TaxID=415221 RepID=A0A934RZU0_9BACT|nr:glycoside hydrolase family 88 protein [Pelagicoccus mobilis]MBK1878369.1 glycoside hydrolase family 88 protein [Pelagicoccus mobilis]
MIVKSRAILLWGSLSVFSFGLLNAEEVATVTVVNPDRTERDDETVHLRLIDLGLALGDPSAESIVAYGGNQPVPVQTWDRNGDGLADTVSLSINLEEVEKKTLSLSINESVSDANAFPQRTYAEISRKFGGEWQGNQYVGGEFANVQRLVTPPGHKDHSYFIRYEGPGWESEDVGYRFYLDWRNGFDIFGKRSKALVLKDVGQDGFDSYHEEAPWGMDILKVGSSLGAGGYGLWVDGKAERISKTDGLECEILENGPVLSQFETVYRGWQGSGEKKMDLKANFSIEAGSRLSWVSLRPEEPAGPFCAGLVKADDVEVFVGDTDITGEAYTYIATWGKQALDGTDMGMAIILKKLFLDEFTEDELNHVVLFNNKYRGVDYAFAAAWSQEDGGFQSKDSFKAYLDETVHRLTIAPRVSITSNLEVTQKSGELSSETALYWTKRMADSILERRGDTLAYGSFDPESGRLARWTYTTGLISKAVYDLAEPTGTPEYADWAKGVISSFIEEDGTIKTYKISDYNIDKINSGKMLLQMHAETGEDRYQRAAAILRNQLEEHPRTRNGAFWHKKRYPWQVWLDGVYMGIPFLVGYEEAYGDKEHLDEAINEFLVCEQELRDSKTGLYWHAWDEAKEQIWADPETGRSEYFWGRGLGWYSMAIVDTLDYAKDHPKASRELKRLLVDLAEALKKSQDPETGVWYQIMDMPNEPGNYKESSASCMFTYMIAKGVNEGWLDESYREVAQKAFSGILKLFVRPHADGTSSLDHICRVAGLGYGRDGSYKYYMSEPVAANDPKGIGPFLMAGFQISKMLNNESVK